MLEVSPMYSSDWDHYQVSLLPQPPQPPSALTGKPVARPLASRISRLLAVGLDVFLSFSPIAAGFIIFQGSIEKPQIAEVRFGIWILGSLVFLSIQMILLSLRGQTLGKMAVGIRIVNFDDASNPGFWRAVVLRGWVPGFIVAIPVFGALFGLADVLSIFGEEKRCIHDLIAGTKVVVD